MAYGFGSGVQAELGATDYSNYLRGALSGAQMQAQGGAAIGAGVQNALAGIGEGIQKYQENKILGSKIMGGVETNIDFLANNNPEAFTNAPKEVAKILKRMEEGKGVGLKDASYLEAWSSNARKDTETNIENTAIAAALAPNPDGSVSTNVEITQRYVENGGVSPEVIRILNSQGKEVTSQYQDLAVSIEQDKLERQKAVDKSQERYDLSAEVRATDAERRAIAKSNLDLKKAEQELGEKEFDNNATQYANMVYNNQEIPAGMFSTEEMDEGNIRSQRIQGEMEEVKRLIDGPGEIKIEEMENAPGRYVITQGGQFMGQVGSLGDTTAQIRNLEYLRDVLGISANEAFYAAFPSYNKQETSNVTTLMRITDEDGKTLGDYIDVLNESKGFDGDEISRNWFDKNRNQRFESIIMLNPALRELVTNKKINEEFDKGLKVGPSSDASLKVDPPSGAPTSPTGTNSAEATAGMQDLYNRS